MLNLTNVDINRLKIFKTIVECGGFAPAAERLAVSDASISIHMAKLESTLGSVLCVRGRSGFDLTPEGEKIHEACQALMLSLDQFSASVGSAKGHLTGTLELGVIDNAVFDPNLKIPQLIKDVKRVAPELQISIHTQSPTELCRGILNQHLHLAIGVFYEHQPGLKYVPICKEKMTLYCGKTHPLYRSKHVSIKQAQKYPFVERNYGITLSNTNVPINANASAYTSSLEATLLLILSGEYIGFLPHYYAQQWSASGHVKPLLPDRLHVETRVSALAHARPTNAKLTNLVLDMCLEQ